MERILNIKEDKEEISIVCNALSSNNRLQIIELIKSLGDDLSHRNIAEKMGLGSSSISFHLTYLINAGIVEEEISKGLKGRNKKVPSIKINKIVIEL